MVLDAPEPGGPGSLPRGLRRWSTVLYSTVLVGEQRALAEQGEAPAPAVVRALLRG